MAGPTPVSALIHAATMVTAGVYLITRMHGLFLAAPAVLFLVAILGTATLLLAACSALVQHDIKRILAYSTMSQIGYMFLAMGVGAWSAAIYHFATHAFFKSALFLGAGHCDQELSMGNTTSSEMGGLRQPSARRVEGLPGRGSDARGGSAVDTHVQQQGPDPESGLAIRGQAEASSGRWASWERS